VALVTVALLSVSTSAPPASADEPLAVASMQCERAAEPGRVRCSVEARGGAGRSLAWADVAILELPSFAAALKGRIGADGVVARDATSEKWAFGIVARQAGQGEARARVRMVVCDARVQRTRDDLPGAGQPPAPGSADAGTSHCVPVTVDVKATLQVG
jgi:hypothetical protein